MFVSGVNNTGAKREKFWGINFFKYFVKSLVECTLNLKIEFLLILRCRQANIGRTVQSPVLLTPPGGVVDTGEQFFGGVVDTNDKF